MVVVFFQAEDGIRDLVRSRGLGDVYKRQELEVGEPLPIPEEMFEEDHVIVRHKRFALHPMSAEEAIDQMELLGHDFYVFFNVEDAAVNVLYRRRDGTFGLLQPEMG